MECQKYVQRKIEKYEPRNEEIKNRHMGVSELRLKSNGHFNSEETAIYFSGNESVKRNGVAILVNHKIQRSLLGYQPVCDRIIYIRLNAYPVIITCIQVYAPTTDADTEEVEEYYQKQVLQEIPKKDFLILMGNWNAKIGKGEEQGIIGNRNEAGERQ